MNNQLARIRVNKKNDTPILAPSDEIKKVEEDSATIAPVAIHIKGFEKIDTGEIVFFIEENEEKKSIKLEDIEKNYPKQLA